LDEYQIEIGQIRRELARLKAAEAARPIIEEVEAQLRILLALYHAAQETLDAGRHDARLRTALRELGFGDWTLTNVYSFVYEATLDAEPDGRDLANVIGHTDWTASLLGALGV
jgi:hypothetical protein